MDTCSSVTAAAAAADTAGPQATRFWSISVTAAAAAADAVSVPKAASASWLVHSVLSILLVLLTDEL